MRILFIIFKTLLVISCSAKQVVNNDTLKLVHIIFRHGDKTPDRIGIYPLNQYNHETYFPYGYGQLTNKGKQRIFMLGKEFRKRYSNFLPDLYSPDDVAAISSEQDRSKMSLQLFMAGLYPPKDTFMDWNEHLNWHPIVYNELPIGTHILSQPYYYCPKFLSLYNESLRYPVGKKLNQKYEGLFLYLSNNTGWNINSLAEATFMYFELSSEKDFGLELPLWSNKVFPEKLTNAAIDCFSLSAATTEQKRLSAGFLIKKIMQDIESKLLDVMKPQGRKVYIYSGHDFNILYFLSAFNMFYPPLPPYGSFVIIELHTINNVSGIKIFYQNGSKEDPLLLKIPQCDSFCPINQFIDIAKNIVPANNDACANNKLKIAPSLLNIILLSVLAFYKSSLENM